MTDAPRIYVLRLTADELLQALTDVFHAINSHGGADWRGVQSLREKLLRAGATITHAELVDFAEGGHESLELMRSVLGVRPR